MNFQQQSDHRLALTIARMCAGDALFDSGVTGMMRYDEREKARREGQAAGRMFKALERAYDAGQIAGLAQGKRAT